MKKSAFLSDLFFGFFVAFTASVCLFRYFRFPLFIAFLCATLFGGICSLLLFFPLDKKRKKTITEKKDAEERDNFSLYLALLPEKKRAEFFQKLSPEPDAKLSFIGGRYALETREDLCFPLFSVRPADGDLAAEVIRVETDKKKTLLCSSLSPEAETLLSRFGVTVKQADEVYRTAKDADALPDSYPFEKEKKKPFKKKTEIWFSKRNAKPFLTGGCLLLFSSLFVPFPAYYLSLGFLLLSAAVFCRIFGKR